MSTQFNLFLSESKLQQIQTMAVRVVARVCGNCSTNNVKQDTGPCPSLEEILTDYIRLAEATRNLVAHVNAECKPDGEAIEAAAVCTWALDELDLVTNLQGGEK